MRIAKEGDVRRQEIIDAALELFYERGYDRTTVQAIVERVGVSKGAFYYYFESKEDVFEAIAWQQAEYVLAIAREIADNPKLDAVEKINEMIARAQEYRTAHLQEILRVYKLMEQGDIRLYHRVLTRIVELSTPVVQQIIEQGVREGLMDVEYPDQLAELWIYAAGILNSSILRLASELEENQENLSRIREKLDFFEGIFERVLGVKEGSIRLAENMLKHIELKEPGE